MHKLPIDWFRRVGGHRQRRRNKALAMRQRLYRVHAALLTVDPVAHPGVLVDFEEVRRMIERDDGLS